MRSALHLRTNNNKQQIVKRERESEREGKLASAKDERTKKKLKNENNPFLSFVPFL